MDDTPKDISVELNQTTYGDVKPVALVKVRQHYDNLTCFSVHGFTCVKTELEVKYMSEKVYVYVQASDGSPLMPTTRCGKIRRLLKNGKAKVVFNIPFTIRLTYEPATKETQPISLGIDPGRTNIGLAAVKGDGTCVYRAHVSTRNKEVPKLMEKRKEHRHASRRGERLRRKRRAKKNGTLMKNGLADRILPGCKKAVKIKDIINTEAKFINRRIPKGWLTPTATHLLRTHINAVNKVKKILPITDVCLEINKFAFMALDNPGVKKKDIDFKHGPLYGYNNLHTAIHEMQHGMCLLCGKNPIERYHHVLSRSNGGGNTIANIVGLCCRCHDAVHCKEMIKRKLDLLHTKSNKKYSALSILNQIIPYLITNLFNTFKDHVRVTYGYYTKQLRDFLGLIKDHDVDACCIALQGFNNDVKIDMNFPKVYNIVQFRRQNRAHIHCQHERSYKFNGAVVAKNRRKRSEQFTDSLHEWYIKSKAKCGKNITRKIQSQLSVYRCKRAHNTMNRVLPGAVFEFEHKRYVLRGTNDRGIYYLAYGCGDKHFLSSKCKLCARNSGLVYVS